MRNTMLLLVPLVLGGCQSWGPTWSEVSGSRYNRIDMNRAETIIQEVDGKTAIPEQGRYRVVRAEPGKRVVTLRAVPLQPAEILTPSSERFTLDVEPCKRYYLNAQYDGPTAKAWKPVVDYVETVAGCQVTAMTK